MYHDFGCADLLAMFGVAVGKPFGDFVGAVDRNARFGVAFDRSATAILRGASTHILGYGAEFFGACVSTGPAHVPNSNDASWTSINVRPDPNGTSRNPAIVPGRSNIWGQQSRVSAIG